MPIIDSHQHFWDRSLDQFDHSWQKAPELSKICRDRMPADLAPLVRQAGVDKTIFVQTQHDVAENRWALGLAEQNDWIAGVVGWVDLASVDCESQLLEFLDHPKFIGVRHVTQDEPDSDFIIGADVFRGLKVLEQHAVPFDLLFYVKHLKHAATVARAFPNLRLVIDHLSKPEIINGKTDGWIEPFRAAAACENVSCKLSGLVTEANWESWSADDLRPYIETALELFGPERCMFGSDWPVCELAATYQQVFDALNDCIGGLSNSERDMILGGTAANFYDI